MNRYHLHLHVHRQRWQAVPGEVFERAGWRQQTQCKRLTWRGLFGGGEAE